MIYMYAPISNDHVPLLTHDMMKNVMQWFSVFCCRWLKLVMEHGVCLLTNVPCTDEGGYEVNPVIQVMYMH